MATKLTNLVITKVALVDEGSCSAAHIKLYKRKEGGNSVMTFEEIMKSLPEDQRKVVEDQMAAAKAEVPAGALSAEDKAKLEKAKQDALTENATLKKQINGESDEDILKSANLDPAVKAIIEKNMAKARASELEILKMKEERENTEFVNKAKEVSLIPEADTKVVDLLKSIRGIDGAAEKVMDILKSANTLIEKGGVFKELGAGGSAGVSTVASEAAWAAIEKAAQDLVVKGVAVTKEKAMDLVLEQQPKLYSAYVEALRNEE